MDDDDFDDYRNADPRVEHRGYNGPNARGRYGGPRYPQSGHGNVHPMTHGSQYPMTHNTGIVPPGMMPYGMSPYGMPPYGYPPYGVPPYGYPPPTTTGSGVTMKKVGVAIRVLAPVFVALRGLPQAPTPIAPSGDLPSDAKNALINQANAITYQTSLAQELKTSETIFALGEAVGLALQAFA